MGWKLASLVWRCPPLARRPPYEVLDGDDHIQKNEDTLQKLKLMKEEFQAFPRNSEVSKSDGSGLNADFVMAFVPKIKQL